MLRILCAHILFTQSIVCTCLDIQGPLNMLLAFSYTLLTFNLRFPLNILAFSLCSVQPSSGSTQSFPVSKWSTSFVTEILTPQVWLDVFLDTMVYDNEYACIFSVFYIENNYVHLQYRFSENWRLNEHFLVALVYVLCDVCCNSIHISIFCLYTLTFGILQLSGILYCHLLQNIASTAVFFNVFNEILSLVLCDPNVFSMTS